MAIKTDDPTARFFGYASPETRAPLDVVDGEQLRCGESEHVYGVERGVPNFLRYPPAESPDETARLESLVTCAAERGCEAALREVDGENLTYVMDDSRAKYLELLPLSDGMRALEVGASKGQHTRLLAPKCASVHALETVRGQAAFGSLWCSELGHSNVRFAVGGDDCRLPYLDGIFDLVILNLVFEWCGRRANEAPSVAQLRMLSECHRVLAPGGRLFLSTKNRYSARLLAGAVDEHTGLRFGNAMPRWLMNLCLRLKGEASPSGLLYSYGGLKKLVAGSGFGRIDSYWALPDARFPSAYLLHDPSAVARARKSPLPEGVDRLTRALMRYAPVSLIARIAPSHVFVAHKD